MNFARFLSIETIRLEMETQPLELEEEEMTKRAKRELQEQILTELAQLLYQSGKVQNESKLAAELIHREKRSSSAIGMGVAIPHLRSLQMKTFVMGFARSTTGLEFDAPDGQGVQIFLPMTAPPYEDRLYLKFYRYISKAFLETSAKEELLEAETEDEVIWIFNKIFRQ